MTKLVVPTEKFFLRFGKIEIFGVGGGNGFGEVCSHTMYAITAKASGSGKIVEGIDEDVNAFLCRIFRISADSPGIGIDGNRACRIGLAED